MAFDKLYKKLETEEGEKGVSKQANAKEKRTSDFGDMRCIKDENDKVLAK